MSTKAHVSTQDFTLASDNPDPRGIWSDGTTMWVADLNDKLYAYAMSNKARVSTQDFTTLSDAGNTDPSGIYSDGSTMWVVDPE